MIKESEDYFLFVLQRYCHFSAYLRANYFIILFLPNSCGVNETPVNAILVLWPHMMQKGMIIQLSEMKMMSLSAEC